MVGGCSAPLCLPHPWYWKRGQLSQSSYWICTGRHFNLRFGKIQCNLACNLLIKSASMWTLHPEKKCVISWDLKVLITFSNVYIDFQWTAFREPHRKTAKTTDYKSWPKICDVSPTGRISKDSLRLNSTPSHQKDVVVLFVTLFLILIFS